MPVDLVGSAGGSGSQDLGPSGGEGTLLEFCGAESFVEFAVVHNSDVCSER